jgi:hypothetical protein
MSVAINPFRDKLWIGFAVATRRAPPKPSVIEPAKGPNGGAAHQWRFIVEQQLGLRRKLGITGIADRDQHIADETCAPDALDRALGE